MGQYLKTQTSPRRNKKGTHASQTRKLYRSYLHLLTTIERIKRRANSKGDVGETGKSTTTVEAKTKRQTKKKLKALPRKHRQEQMLFAPGDVHDAMSRLQREQMNYEKLAKEKASQKLKVDEEGYR